MPASGKAKELTPGLFVTRIDHLDRRPPCYEYVAESKIYSEIDLCISLASSTNMSFSTEKHESLCHTRLFPLERRSCGVAVVADEARDWKLQAQFSWKVHPVSRDYMRRRAAEEVAVIEREMLLSQTHGLGADSRPPRELIAYCIKNKLRYVDEEFPPVESSLHAPGLPGLRSSRRGEGVLTISWRRASDFLGDKVQVFRSGIEPEDIRQGRLGDCWLMCAIAALAEYPHFIERIFTLPGEERPQEANAAGFYQLRLCNSGEWTTIRLDDIFPCFPGGGPVFSKANGDELWVLLLEKAFAAIHGNYDALRGGLSFEALMTLTGSPSIRIATDELDSEALWQLLCRCDSSDNIMSCSVPGEDKWSQREGIPIGGPGLVSGHSYSLLDARTLSTGTRLVQLRNPWGRFEWNGDWSDASPLWTPELRNELGGSAVAADDGKFWMCLHDFKHYFTHVNMCFLHAEPRRPWREVRLKGHFSYHPRTYEVASSAQYALKLPPSSRRTETCWVSLHQQDERTLTAKPYIDLGVVVLRASRSGDALELVKGEPFLLARQNQVELELEPGATYYIVPMTSGILRHYFDEDAGSRSHMTGTRYARIFDSHGRLTQNCEAAVREVFRRFDEDMDSLLNFSELGQLYRLIHHKDLSEHKYDKMVRKYDSQGHAGLTPDGLVEYFVRKDEGRIWEDLMMLGYDRKLFLARARTFVLSVHTLHLAEVTMLDFSAATLASAQQLWFETHGKLRSYEDGRIKIYEALWPNGGASVGVWNGFPELLVVEFDFSKSKGISSYKPLAAPVEVLPGEFVVANHVISAGAAEAWTWGYSFKWSLHPLPAAAPAEPQRTPARSDASVGPAATGRPAHAHKHRHRPKATATGAADASSRSAARGEPDTSGNATAAAVEDDAVDWL